MAKEKSLPASGLAELFQFGVYKRNQGRITRQVTFAALAVVFALAAWRLGVWLTVSWDLAPWVPYGVPGLVLLVGLWVSYRLVNWPTFADFLIAVEAEMNKVSWASRAEIIRSSLVVIFVIFVMAAALYAFDYLWVYVFQFIF